MSFLKIRIWIAENKEMLYPEKYSVMSLEDGNVSVRTFLNNVRYDSLNPMLKTSSSAINGDIYEGDIVAPILDDNDKGSVEYNEENNSFEIKFDDRREPLKKDMLDYLIICNIFNENINTDEKMPEKEITPEKTEENNLTDKEPAKKIDIEIASTTLSNDKDLPNIDSTIPEDIEIPFDIEIPEDISFPEEIMDDYIQDTEESINVISEPIIEETYIPKNIEVFFSFKTTDKDTGPISYVYIIEDQENVLIEKSVFSNGDIRDAILLPVISAIEKTNPLDSIIINSPTEVVVAPFKNKWIEKWASNNWKKDDRQEVKSKKLWEKLYNLSLKHNIEWNYVTDNSEKFNKKQRKCNTLAKKKFDENMQ